MTLLEAVQNYPILSICLVLAIVLLFIDAVLRAGR